MLPSQYGCNIALITFADPCSRRRTRSLAAVSLIITISSEHTEADGSKVEAPITDLTAAVTGVTDVALSSALTAALGTTVLATSTAPQQTITQKVVAFICVYILTGSQTLAACPWLLSSRLRMLF